MRNQGFLLRLFLFFSLLPPGSFLEASASSAADRPTVALVIWVQGDATWTRTPGAVAEPLRLLTRLSTGDGLVTGADAQVEVVFQDGRRFSLGEESRAVLQMDAPQLLDGALEELPPVPVLARLPAIAPEEMPGQQAGAERLRQSQAREFALYPRERAAVESDTATLRFSAVQGIETYHVEVTDIAGEPLFTTQTHKTEVRLPAGVLRPGTLHYWQVSSGPRHAHTLHGSALFVTLTPEEASAREALAQQASKEDAPPLKLLLAAFDLHLGQRREACDSLEKMASTTLDNPAVARLQQRLCTTP